MKKIIAFFYSKSMFVQLMSSFLLVILVVSSFQLITNSIYRYQFEQELINNTYKRFDYITSKTNQEFESIILGVLVNLNQEFGNSLRSGNISTIEVDKIKKKMLDYVAQNNLIENIIIINSKDNTVLDYNGKYNKDIYFNKNMSNENYGWKYWLNQLGEDYMFKILPVDNFTEFSNFGWVDDKTKALIPIIYKEKKGSNFCIIAFIDAVKFERKIEPDFLNGFSIYSLSDGKTIYPATDKNNINIEVIKKDLKSPDGILNKKEGLSFVKKVNFTSLAFYKYSPNEMLREYMNKTNTLFNIIIIISIALGIILSVLIIKSFNNPVKQIMELIKQSNNMSAIPNITNMSVRSGENMDIINLRNITNTVKNLVEKNKHYENDINKKDSILKSFYYREKLLNMFSGTKEVQNEFDSKHNSFSRYIVVAFKVHCREEFQNLVPAEYRNSIFVLNELIDRYINSYFTEAVTFQVENNTIISIINVEDNMVAVMNKIRLIADKLGTEKDYVYFTVIVSQIYNEISRLNQAYKKVGELEKYRTLSEKTQIIVEGDTKVNDTLYFTKMQKEQIENLFLKNKYEECIEHIISILMYNAEQGVSSFSMFLLSTEIFNSCNDVLIKLFNKIPSDFNIKKMYSMLKEYETIEEYKKIWKNFIKEYSGYIYANKGEDDEIIYSVKQYIKENYTSDISVDIIAEKLKMSRSYLSRYFKEKTNECLSDYINRYRIQIASELLKTSSLPINDVYLSVGINNNVTFNRLFKKYTGMTPNTYRRINNFKEEQGLNSL